MEKVFYAIAAGIYLAGTLPPHSGVLVVAYLTGALASAAIWVWMGLLLAKLDDIAGSLGTANRSLNQVVKTLRHNQEQ